MSRKPGKTVTNAERLKFPADKNQAGQISNIAQNFCRQVEETKTFSNTIPKVRGQDQKTLNNQFTFADLEMVEVYHQQSVESQIKLEKQLLAVPTDHQSSELVQLKSEFTFNPKSNETKEVSSRKMIMTTSGSL